MKSAFFFIVPLLLIYNVASIKHECIHDRISKEFEPVPLDLMKSQKNFLHFNKIVKHAARAKEYTITRPIKILIDGSNLKDVQKEKKDFILNTLVPISTEFLEKRLTVLTRGTPLRLSGDLCIEAPIPEIHKTQGFDADLVIYVTAKPSPGDKYLAWASSCFLDPVTGRPIAGQVHFNTHYVDLSPSEFEDQVDTVLHEITHIIAFSNHLFKGFKRGFFSNEKYDESEVSEQALIQGRNKTIIKTPKLLEVAKQYFNCSSIRGVETEDEGGEGTAGSHWERAILHNEMMTASSVKDAAYSAFTLALLQDSGWYKVDFSKAEPMFYGKGAGCSFVTKKCQAENFEERNEFCKDDEYLCSFDFKIKGHCEIEAYSDGCMYAKGYKDGDCENPNNQLQFALGETYGRGSRCVMSNIIDKEKTLDSARTSCFPHRCTQEGTVIFTLNDGSELVCSDAGEQVTPPEQSNFKGRITCPDPNKICQEYYPACPNSCSFKGYCVRGACECSLGFTGADCSSLANQIDSENDGSQETSDSNESDSGNLLRNSTAVIDSSSSNSKKQPWEMGGEDVTISGDPLADEPA